MNQERTVEGEGFVILLDGQRFPVSYRLTPESDEKLPRYRGVIRGTQDVINKAAKAESYFSLLLSDGRRIEGRIESTEQSGREGSFASTSSIHNPTTVGRG